MSARVVELLDAMRAAPEDARCRVAYAEWLSAQGDVRGEILGLQERWSAGEALGLAEVERFMALTAEHGFVYVPDDPCAGILPFTGGGSYPTQYDVDHEGHHYYLRWRYGFSIDVDDVDVLECDLDTLTTNEWTFRETNVILAIVSEAIREGRPLSTLTFPDQAGFRAHPRYHAGRCPHFVFPESFMNERGLVHWAWAIEVRDWPRWYALWNRRCELLGVESSYAIGEAGCRCGVLGMSCRIDGCHIAR